MKHTARALLSLATLISLVLSACNGNPKQSSFDEEEKDAGALPDNTGLPDGGSLNAGFEQPIQSCLDENKNTAACERCCETQLAEGYGVYTGAIDRCACQPSQCGGACEATLCADPRLEPPGNSDCVKCVQLVLKRQPTPPEYEGGGSPELNVTDCRAYGAEVCLASAECQRTERCKKACRDAYRPDGG